MYKPYYDNNDKLKEECGVIGVFLNNCDNIDNYISNLLYNGLISLQHRGQQSAGITVISSDNFNTHKGLGLVHNVFNNKILNTLNGNIGIGHVRYSTIGKINTNNSQPLTDSHCNENFAYAHNGQITNTIFLKNYLDSKGIELFTTVDSEIIGSATRCNMKSIV